jgi:ABC-type antimicrobial peptide transport system permease subunit
MIRNYLIVTLRNIFKHKGYAIINIVGLALGMACCLLICIWVLDELSYDRFHGNASSLYRVEENQHYSGRIYHVTVTPYPLGPALESEISGIKDATRVVWAGGQLLRHGDKAFFESDIRAVDPSFLQMFTFPLLKGEKDTALDSPHSLIISEDIADKYFPDEDPLGKAITVNNSVEFKVTGVIRNVPHNSYLQFDILVPYAYIEKAGRANQSFGSNSIFTFVQLEQGVSMEEVNPKILGFIRTRIPQSATDLELMPYTRIHLHQHFGFEKTMGAAGYVYIFSVIALFVLIIACINFMNLATARSANRAREVGLRKVVGALRGHLIRRFYGESVVFAVIALVLAAAIVTLLLPAFGSLADKDLSWKVSGIGGILIGLLGITVFTGILAGTYPALFLSAFQPVRVLRGALKTGSGASRFRRTLVVFQFMLSLLLIIGTTVVYKQLSYMRARKLGWDREHLIYIPLRADIKQSYQALKDELVRDRRILGVTASSHLPTNIGSNSGGAQWEGKDPEQSVLIGFSAVDFDYIETLKIEMKEGRSFSRDRQSDLSEAFIVNEEVAALMGREAVAGERFSFLGIDGQIIGVMKSFHFKSVREVIEPLAIVVAPDRLEYMLIRLAPGDIPASLRAVEDVWHRVIPSYPFDYHFLDEDFDLMYRAESRIGTLLKYFTVLAVLIACLGLFGLASFTAEQRTKEIGIRKVLGASVTQVTLLLCREFFLLVLLANILAWPLAYFGMAKWLNNYAYRTDLGIIVFVGAMVLALAVALVAVGFQAIRAATASPAAALKYE